MSILEKIHHQITGLGSEKLVFLHGVMGFSANWRRIAKAFESDFQVLVYDQRGHGRSFQPESGYGPEDYAQDLKQILKELGWDTVRLVGHSMGGRAAFHFASENPERVTQLVIEDIGPAMGPTGVSLVTRMLDATPMPFPDKRAARAWFDTEFQRIFADESRRKELAEYLYANVTENAAKQAVWRFSEAGIREAIEQGKARDRWDEVRRLSMETLVIRGEFSEDLPREIFDQMLQANPKLKGTEVADAGHWVHSDQPDLFIRILQSFFCGEAASEQLTD